jgi:tRNA/tmRNA/rRNA uracil-C5-methylase (TrmA/RlmC/RlmD family)
MHCALYDAGRCRSCQWLELPVSQQLADKMADLRALWPMRPSLNGAHRFAARKRVSQQSQNGGQR